MVPDSASPRQHALKVTAFSTLKSQNPACNRSLGGAILKADAIDGDMMAATGATMREILVVDDSLPTARALAELLTRDGFEVAVYTTGAEALDYLNVGKPAAAVVDIHLPDISGLTVTQYLRESHGPDVPIIVISGDSSMGNISSLSVVGATYFYSKPVRASDLLKRLRELTGVRPA